MHKNSTIIKAKVLWPPDLPDDILEDAITIAKKALEEHDFEAEGTEVSYWCSFLGIDCKDCQKAYG